MNTTKSNAKVTFFNPAEYLDIPDIFAGYLSEALDTGDAVFVADALGVIARACGMSEVACELGVSPESLYLSLSTDGNPEFATVMRVAKALGLRLSVTPRKAA